MIRRSVAPLAAIATALLLTGCTEEDSSTSGTSSASTTTSTSATSSAPATSFTESGAPNLTAGESAPNMRTSLTPEMSRPPRAPLTTCSISRAPPSTPTGSPGTRRNVRLRWNRSWHSPGSSLTTRTTTFRIPTTQTTSSVVIRPALQSRLLRCRRMPMLVSSGGRTAWQSMTPRPAERLILGSNRSPGGRCPVA